jgi:hypothetical protein
MTSSYQFNWKKYIHTNTDLQKNNVYSKKIAWRHLIKFGLKEKRDGVEFKNYVTKEEVEKNYVIIFSHHNNGKLEKYWIHNYECIRKLYPNIKIIIIDDNSMTPFNYKYLDEHTKNTSVIESKFPGSGELLCYYYYLINNFSKNAIIIHDSVFLKEHLDIDKNYKFQPLWHFESFHWYNDLFEPVMKILSKLKFSNELKQIYKSKDFLGCFGMMSVIQFDYLQHLNNKYALFPNILRTVNNRRMRMAFERILPIIIKHDQHFYESIFLSIHKYTNSITLGRFKFNFSFQEYMKHQNKIDSNSEIVKIWSGR